MISKQRTMPRPFTTLPPVEESSFSRFVASVDPAWIEEALDVTGTATVRRRRLPAEQVIWLVLGMALYRRCAIDELVERLQLVLPGKKKGGGVARSAVAQARARLGDEPLEWLFNCCAQKWAHESARKLSWRGLALYGVDGTTVRVPDSPENRAHFGGQDGGADRGPSGYPLARIVTLMALRSHLIAAASFGPYSSEQPYAEPFWEMVPNNAVAIVDRNFFNAKILIPIAREGENRHWLTRAKSNTAWKHIKKLGAGDDLVELGVSREAKKSDPSLPDSWTVRAIRYQRKGFRPQTILTSLLDRAAYPAKEIVALYHERWEIELGYDEVKTELLERQETLRSRSPSGVAQELWAIGLVYNLIRREMEQIAAEAGVAPSRISFIAALHLIQEEWKYFSITASPGRIPRNLRELRERIARYILPERRSNRSFPRAVKIKMSNYARKRPVIAGPTAK